MVGRLLATVFLLFLVFTSALFAQQADRSGAWAIKGATVIDGRGGDPIPDGIVVVDRGVIRCVGTRDQCPLFGILSIIEGDGLWVMPGLIDPEVRMPWSTDSLGVQDAQNIRLAVGITLVREAGSVGDVESNIQARERASDPFRPEPRILVTGAVESKNARDLGSDGLVEVAQELARRSVDGLLVTGLESGPQLDSIFRVARSWAIPVYGGIPNSRLGDEEVFALAERGVRVVQSPEAMGRGDEELIGALVKNRIAVNPSLTSWQNDGHPEPHLPHLDFLAGPRPVRDLIPFFGSAEARALEEARITAGPEYAKAASALKEFRDRGGHVLAGASGSRPGSGLLVELGLLQDAGIEAPDLVTLATHEAARELGVDKRFGSVRRGMAADLLLLNADPSVDIRNTQKVWRVVKGGVIYDPLQLLEPYRLRFKRETRYAWQRRAGHAKWLLVLLAGIGGIVWYRRKNAWRL
ncbi:MAG: hypothetical protein HKN29_15345 [Rhodothermales bacterium]|nr:hypothetical protein [Rhodothermales bacterium]